MMDFKADPLIFAPQTLFLQPAEGHLHKIHRTTKGWTRLSLAFPVAKQKVSEQQSYPPHSQQQRTLRWCFARRRSRPPRSSSLARLDWHSAVLPRPSQTKPAGVLFGLFAGLGAAGKSGVIVIRPSC